MTAYKAVRSRRCTDWVQTRSRRSVHRREGRQHHERIGQIIVDENGYPQYSDELQYIGECTPDWKGGFGTSVKWKGLTVSVAFDGQHGGNVYSYTNAVLGTRAKAALRSPDVTTDWFSTE